jgi:hypothetical protein
VPPSTYPTTAELADNLDLPVNVPLADLWPDTWLVLSSLTLATPQTLAMRFLQLHILGAIGVTQTAASATATLPNASGQCPVVAQAPVEVNTGLGLAWVGLYATFDPLSTPVGQVAAEPTVSIPTPSALVLPVWAARPTTLATYAQPGTYSFVVYNNTANYILRLAVSGQARVSLTGT